MCKALRILRLFGLVLLPAGAAPAQTTAVLRARVDSLQREYNRLQEQRHAANAAADSAIGWRRFTVGSLRLDVAGELVRTAPAELAAAHGRLEAIFGPALDAGGVIPIRATPRVPGAGELPAAQRPLGVSVQYDSLGQWGQPATAPFVAAGAPPGRLADAIIRVGSEGRWYRIDRVLARWHPSPPGSIADSVLARETFVELATSTFPGGGACIGGSLDACARMVGMVADPTDLVGSYGPDDRRAFVSRLIGGYLGPLSAQAERCVTAKSLAACDAVLRGREWGALVPLGESPRGLLLATALHLGGPAAVQRLLAHPDLPLDQRLAEAAGVSRDSLLSAWRAAALSAREDPRAELPRTAMAAAGWGLLIFALAIGGARWR